jgi:hypothetical protein
LNEIIQAAPFAIFRLMPSIYPVIRENDEGPVAVLDTPELL